MRFLNFFYPKIPQKLLALSLILFLNFMFPFQSKLRIWVNIWYTSLPQRTARRVFFLIQSVSVYYSPPHHTSHCYQTSHKSKQSACQRSKLSEVQGQAVHMYVKKSYTEVELELHQFLTLAVKGLMPPTVLTPEKAHPIPTDLLLAGHQNWSGGLYKKKKETDRDNSPVPCQKSTRSSLDFPPSCQKL